MSMEFSPEEFYLNYPQEVISRPGYPARAAYKSRLLWDMYGGQVKQSVGEIKQYADIGGCFGFGANALSYYISKSQKSRLETHVFEISGDYISIGKELFPRIQFHSTAFELWNEPPQNFDLISLFDLVEHLVDPRPLLMSVSSRAKFVLLKTPLETFGEWRGSHSPELYGKEHPDGHVQFFTPGKYEALLAECGLEIVKSKIVSSIIPRGAEDVLDPEKDYRSKFRSFCSTLRHPLYPALRQLPFSISRKILVFGTHLSLCKSSLV